MRDTEPWRNLPPQDFDHALEGMEKLVMNRLYDYTFTPYVATLVPPRPITVDDLDKDRALDQRIRLFTWLEPQHLDVPDEEGAPGFLAFAQQGLLYSLCFIVIFTANVSD
jgi:Rab5 GDP/GTP exchange factor